MPSRLAPEDVGIGRLFWLISDAVVVGDAATGLIELWNPGAERVFGYGPDQAIGMPISSLVDPDLRDAHEAGLRRYHSTGRITVARPGEALELPAVHRNGDKLWVSLTLAEMRLSDRSLVVACMRDVTDRRLAEDALRQSNAALRQFIAVAAHDLRGPLTTLNASLDLLSQQDDQLPATLGRFVSIAQRHGRAVMDLVAELLDLAQLDAGVMTANSALVDVATAVDAAASLAGASDLVLQVAPGAELVAADAAHVRRILLNLLTNALRHGAPPITVVAAIRDEQVEIHVRDAGSGVPATLVAHLFEPYARDDAGGGTGLGLAISRRLARLNSGDVTYAATTDEGAEFILRLPRPA